MRQVLRHMRLLTVVAAMACVSVLWGDESAGQDWEWTGGFVDDRWGWCGQFDPNWSISPGFPGVLHDCTGDSNPDDYRGVSVMIGPGPEHITTTGVSAGIGGEFRLGSLTVEGSTTGGQPRLSLGHLLILDGPGSFKDVTLAANLIANEDVSLLDGCRWVNATTIDGNGSLNVDGGIFTIGSQNTGRFLDFIPLTNNAQVIHFNNLQLLSNAIIHNHGVWTLGNTIHDATFDLAPGEGGLISNNGVFTTNLGTRTATINAPFFSAGDINVNESTVTIGGGGVHSAGTYTIVEDAVLAFSAAVDETHISGDVNASGAGTLHFTHDFVIDPLGSLTLDLPGSEFFNFTGALLGSTTSAATMTLDGALINNEKLWWTGMTVDGAIGLENTLFGELFLTEFGGQDLRVLESTLLNRGLVVQDEPLVMNNGTIANKPSAIWLLVEDGITGTGSIENEGVIEKPASPPAGVENSVIGVPLNLVDGGVLRASGAERIILTGGGTVAGDGTMEVVGVLSGIEIQNSTYVLNADADLEFKGDGFIEVNNSTLVLNTDAESTNNGPGFFMTGGLVAGSGLLVNKVGSASLDGTTIGINAVVRNDWTMDVANVTVDGALINSEDEVMTQSSHCTINDGGVAVNFGRYEIQADLTINSGGVFNNNGLFIQPLAAGATVNTVSGRFANGFNDSTVHVEAGTLLFTGPLDDLTSGVLTDGTWIVDPGATLNLGGCASVIAIGAGATVIGDLDGLSNCFNLATNDGALTLNGDFSTPGNLDNNGNLQVDAGTTLINGDYNCGDADGATTGVGGMGEFQCTGNINSSVLSDCLQTGTGALAGGVGGYTCQNFNNSSHVLPGGRNATGPFNVTGTFNQFGIGTLEIDLNGSTPISAHDQLIVTDGDVNLAGTLDLTVLPSFNPTGGEQFTIITVSNGQVSGQFDQITGGGAWTVEYDSESVVLTLDAPPCLADADANGAVNVLDLLQVLSEWGACPTGCDGDVNFDNVVDVLDLLLVLTNWGQCN